MIARSCLTGRSCDTSKGARPAHFFQSLWRRLTPKMASCGRSESPPFRYWHLVNCSLHPFCLAKGSSHAIGIFQPTRSMGQHRRHLSATIARKPSWKAKMGRTGGMVRPIKGPDQPTRLRVARPITGIQPRPRSCPSRSPRPDWLRRSEFRRPQSCPRQRSPAGSRRSERC